MRLDQTIVVPSNVAALGHPHATISFGCYTLSSAIKTTDQDALDNLLLECYGVIVGKLAAAGVNHRLAAEGLKSAFWLNIDRFPPPTGRLILVHDDAGGLVGCGTLQQNRSYAREVKRLYIRPEASGNGLGRAIVDARKQAARQMGWSKILVNAIRGN